MEEETELKNHMKWARILVANSGRNIPKEVSISRGGIRYHFPIWVEGKARYEILPEKVLNLAGEEDNNLKSGYVMDQQIIRSNIRTTMA